MIKDDTLREYTFVRTFVSSKGKTFLEVEREGKKYNVIPHPFQIINPPAKVYCRVHEVDETGYTKLSQDFESALRSYFHPNKAFYFKVLEKNCSNDSDLIEYKVRDKNFDFTFTYRTSRYIYEVGEEFNSCVSIKVGSNGNPRLFFISEYNDDGFIEFEPKNVFESINKTELYVEYFENFLANTDELELVFDEMIEKINYQNKLWLFDYIRLLEIKSAIYRNSDIEKSRICNRIIIDIENWILEESTLLTNFNPTNRDDAILKAETKIEKCKIDNDIYQLIIDNNQHIFINELLEKLKSRKPIRDKHQTFRKLYRLIKLDQNILDTYLLDISQIIVIASVQIIEPSHWEAIISAYKKKIVKDKQLINTSIHFYRDKAIDTKQLLSLVLGTGTLLYLYKISNIVDKERFDFRGAFINLCKYLSFFTSKDNAFKLNNLALRYLFSTTDFSDIKFDEKKLLRFEQDKEGFIDSLLSSNVLPTYSGVQISQNCQIQYAGDKLLVIPISDSLEEIEDYTIVYNIPDTDIYIASNNLDKKSWVTNNEQLAYYKSSWDDLYFTQDVNEQIEKNTYGLISVKESNGIQNKVFCTLVNAPYKTDGVISKHNYFKDFYNGDIREIFDSGTQFNARIIRSKDGKIYFDIDSSINKYSCSCIKNMLNVEQLGLCVRIDNRCMIAYFITQSGVLCNVKLEHGKEIKIDYTYNLIFNGKQNFNLPSAELLSSSKIKLYRLELLRILLSSVSKYDTSISSCNDLKQTVLPNTLLLVDNYIQHATNDIDKYNLYHVARIIASAEKSPLYSYYNSKIAYMESIIEFTHSSSPGKLTNILINSEQKDSASRSFPSLKQQELILSILNEYNNGVNSDFLLSIITNDEVSDEVQKLAKLIFASNIISDVGGNQQIISSIKKLINSEVLSSTSLHVSDDTLELIEDTTIDEVQTQTYFGKEDFYKEFKTSIVYSPEKSTPDYNVQILTIMKTIVGFLNSKGGDLYIGINDEGLPSGIQSDLDALGCNIDAYERKIRQEIVENFGKDVNGTISFTFMKSNNCDICKINVPPYYNPVALDNEFYQRQGNETRILKGNDLVLFIKRRSFDKVVEPVSFNSADVQETKENLPIGNSSSPQYKENLTEYSTVANFSTYFNMYKNFNYSLGEKDLNNDNILFQLKLSLEKESCLLLCYDNGCVNKVPVSSILEKRENYTYLNGLFKGATLVCPILAYESDYIMISTMWQKRQYVKIYPISNISAHRDLHLKGNQLVSLSKEMRIKSFCVIPGKYNSKFAKLIYLSRTGCGRFIMSDYYKSEYEWLNKYIRGGYQEEPDLFTNDSIDVQESAEDNVIKSINNRDIVSLKKIFVGAEGAKVIEFRQVIMSVLKREEIKGSSFWYFVDALMDINSKGFSRPIYEFLNSTINIKDYYSSDTLMLQSVFRKILSSNDKIEQGLKIIQPFKLMLDKQQREILLEKKNDIDSLEGFSVYFDILSANINQRVYILTDNNSSASRYTLIQELQSFEEKYGLKGLNSIIGLDNVLNKLNHSDSYIDKMTYRLILKTVFHNEGIMKSSEVRDVLSGKYESFVKNIRLYEQKEFHNTIFSTLRYKRDIMSVQLKVAYVASHYYVMDFHGITVVLPKELSKKTYSQFEKIDVNFVKAVEKEKLIFAYQKRIINASQLALLKKNDEVLVKFSMLGNAPIPTLIGHSKIKANITRYPDNFDYKRKYTAQVISCRQNVCDIKILNEKID